MTQTFETQTFEQVSDQACDQAEVPDPRNEFDRPRELLADEGLSREEKLARLELWQAELDDRLKAEEEGMSAQDPMHHRDETALADEASKVHRAILELKEE